MFELLSSKDAEHSEIRSIQDNLHHLLNTRQGSIQHMPDYGLPDLQSVYQSFPNGKTLFLAQTKKVIEKFEPRLEKVSLLEEHTSSWCGVLTLLIHAVINEKAVRFLSCFYSKGNVHVTSEI